MRLGFALTTFVVAISLLFARTAAAKSISIEWQDIEGAHGYELQILQPNGEPLEGRKAHLLEKPRWRGDLSYGVYSYRIRALDRLKRPGLWSEPQPLAVMPGTPEPQTPRDGSKLRFFHPDARTILSWKAVEGVSDYQLEVKRDGKPHFSAIIKGTQADLGPLPPGQYSWNISSVLRATNRSLAAFRAAGLEGIRFEGRTWSGEQSGAMDFQVERPPLESPRIISPEGTLPPPDKGELLFRWRKVQGAEKYELRFVKALANASPEALSRALSAAKPAVTTNDSVKLRVPEGKYAWQVRALASLPSGGADHPGPESQSTFELNRNAVFSGGAGYVAFSTMLAPYTYQVISPSFGASGETDSAAMTVRASGEYWPWAQWGLGAGIDVTTFSMNGESFGRTSTELTVKYQANITRDRFGWFIAPKAGVESRQYLLILPEFRNDSPEPVGTLSRTQMAFGPTLGLDLRKQFSERWSMGAKFAFFVPMGLSGHFKGRITPEASYRNISFGVQGLYWWKKNIGVSAGTFAEKRSLSFQPDHTPNIEQIFMDGTYFFGSVIYRFGLP